MIIVTGSDGRYFALAEELILSIEACWPAPVPIGFVDLGINLRQRAWLDARGIIVRPAKTGFDLDRMVDDLPSKIGYLARPFLNEIFPGHSIYVWLDADVWLQSWDGVQKLRDGAAAKGAAMVRENQKAYRFWLWLYCWQLKHYMLGCGVVPGVMMWPRPHVNAGIFAIRADAPHWNSWRKYYQRALDRTHHATPYDQFSLNAAAYRDRLPTEFLPTTCNWIVNLGVPMWDSETGKLCVPYPPFTLIAHIHLAGPVKTRIFDIKTRDGAVRSMRLRFGRPDTAEEKAHRGPTNLTR
jgi:hypothetical protein